MLFCKIFVVVIIYTFKKHENQNSTINNFIGLTFTLRAQKMNILQQAFLIA
jgi:hypothetical protein